MDFLIRAIKNVYRKKSKSILLFITFFIIANIVFCGFAVLSASQNISTEIRRKLGTEVLYQIDYTKFYDEYYENCEKSGEECEYKQPPALSIETAKQIANHENVAFFDITMTAFFKALNGHQFYYTEEDKERSPWYFDEENQSATINAQILGGAGKSILDFENSIVSLVEGRLYTEEEVEQEKPVVVISEELAILNGYQIGDFIDMGVSIPEYNSKWEVTNWNNISLQFEIIGLFDVLVQPENDSIWDPTRRPENIMYVPFSVVDQVQEEAFYIQMEMYNKDEGNEYTYQPNFTVVYNIDDPINIDKFREDSKKYLTSDYHMLYANDHQFEQMNEPIKSINVLAKIATYAMVLNGAIIVSLITALTLRERNYEIGVFLSIGVSKIKIISQFFIELLVVAAIAFTLSLGTGHLLTGKVSEILISNGAIGEMEEPDIDIGFSSKVSSIGKPGILPIEDGNEVNFGEIVNNTTFGLTRDVVINVFLSGLFIILISTLIPSLLIMRFNPKKILADK